MDKFVGGKMALEEFNTTIQDTSVKGIINYVDMSTNYYFLPSVLFLIFIVLLINNRTKFAYGWTFAGFIMSLTAFVFKWYFDLADVWVGASIFMFAVGVAMVLFGREW